MTLGQATDIASIAGTVAVVVTLILLLLQLRRNTQSLRSIATYNAHEQLSALYDRFDDSTFIALYLRATEDPEALSRDQTVRLNAFFFRADVCAQNWLFQTRDGAMPGELLSSWSKLIQRVTQTEAWKRYWEQRRFVFAPEYVEFIEEMRVDGTGSVYRPVGAAQNAPAGTA